MYKNYSNNPNVDYGPFIPESKLMSPKAEMERIARASQSTTVYPAGAQDMSYNDAYINSNRTNNDINVLSKEFDYGHPFEEPILEQLDATTIEPSMVAEKTGDYAIREVMNIVKSNAFELGKLLWDRSQTGVKTPSHLAIPEESSLKRLTQKELKHIYHALKQDPNAVKVHTGKGWIENYGKEKLHKDLGCFSVEGEVNGFSHDYSRYDNDMEFIICLGEFDGQDIAVIKVVDNDDNDYYYVPDFFFYRGYNVLHCDRVSVSNIMYFASKGYLSRNIGVENPNTEASDAVYKMIIAMLMFGDTAKVITGGAE